MRKRKDEEKRLGKLLGIDRKERKRLKQAGKYDLLVEYREAIELLILLRKEEEEETEKIPEYVNDDEIKFNKGLKLAKFGFIIIILLLIYMIGEFFKTQNKIEKMLNSTTLIPAETNKIDKHENIAL